MFLLMLVIVGIDVRAKRVIRITTIAIKQAQVRLRHTRILRRFRQVTRGNMDVAKLGEDLSGAYLSRTSLRLRSGEEGKSYDDHPHEPKGQLKMSLVPIVAK